MGKTDVKKNRCYSHSNYGKKSKFFVGDFETTVYEGQTKTEVWASAIVEFGTENVKIFHSIEDTFDYLVYLNCPMVLYYHNLKFDGSFWLDFLMRNKDMKHAFNEEAQRFIEPKEMENNSFSYVISDMGQWYSIVIKVNNHIIELRDSLKLLPFSVERIGKAFETKHKKLSMAYEGYRYAGCVITDEEKEYIANDVLVVKEALEIMFEEKHNRITIGSCCLSEYKSIVGKEWFNLALPDLTGYELDSSLFDSKNVDEYVRKSYRGGWCYLVKGKENKIFHHGVTADVNSLYPSMMSSESGNRYPIGEPTFWKGDYIPDEALAHYSYYFIRFRCGFSVKKGYLPFVQIKNNVIYRGNECLTTSDMYDMRTKTYRRYWKDTSGNVNEFKVTLTMTMTDFELFKKHYDIRSLEILDGCFFESRIGIFDEYMEKYKKIKMESKGAKRELAKLFLNNLYGKMATNPKSNFKVCRMNPEKNALTFETISDTSKKPGFIPIGSAITSYARCFTITAAQLNYHGVDKPGFIYADTDSIHTDLSPVEIKGVPVHPTKFCHWKLESTWDEAIFVRQKTYIERVIEEDLKPIEKPYYNIRCAGMPEDCKKLFLHSMQGTRPDNYAGLREEEKLFVDEKRTIKEFCYGLIVPGKLRPKRIEGGVILVPTTFEMK